MDAQVRLGIAGVVVEVDDVRMILADGLIDSDT